MTTFLEAIWGDTYPYGELRLIREGEVRQQFFEHNEHMLLDTSAQSADAEGWDVYFGVLPRLRRAGSDHDALPTTRVLWQDIDLKRVEGGHVAALLGLQRGGIDPSILVDSGYGLHAYHLLRDPVVFDRARAVMKGMAEVVGGDHTYNASRVLRLPGTHNHKRCNHGITDAFVEPCKPVRLLYFNPDRLYRISDFDRFIKPEMPRQPYDFGEVWGWEVSKPDAPKFGEGQRNNGLTRLAGIMRARGMDEDEIWAALMAENLQRCVPPLPDREVANIAHSITRYAQ